MPIITDAAMPRAHVLDALRPPALSVVERLIALAQPAHVYAAGGAVRDAVLGSPASDVDLVVEGDAIGLARAAAAAGCRVRAHPRFGTATIDVGSARAGSNRIDVAMARSETYTRPGALPKVMAADIETDLRRRDFTVNAMALRLDGEAKIIDPCGGIDDLRARRIRVLHDASFRDDATRIFRAFRYAARLGFEIERHTRALIDDGVRYIKTIGGERLRRELELLFSEDSGADALGACDATGALRAIHSALRWTSVTSAAVANAPPHAPNAETRSPFPRREGGKGVRFAFALLTADASPDDATAVVTRLKLKRHEAAAVIGIASLRATAAPMLARPDAKPSGVVQLLDRYPEASIAAYGAMNGDSIAGRLALQYLETWRHVKPSLGGRDLQALNVPEGPRIAQALQLLRAARLDGGALDVDDERALVARFVAAIRDSSAMNASVELHLNGR